ncbi:MAG: zinc metallopeptidase [Dysgonamonadaceae bacterium]|jgi:Zn-dependent membrane protease YugP|nr:zinc metallopeptidase [Dysgonamonadaceae bacterium]
MGIYWLLFIGTALAGWLVQWNFNSKFKKYSKMPLDYGMTGKEIAERMLYENGIANVKVKIANGILSDHYNPADRSINLSTEVYSGNSIAAAAVAAHETGHAIQHAKAYGPLKMRSALVPVVTFSSQWVTWILLGGMLLMGKGTGIGSSLLLIGICLYAVLTIFSFITLPVEINASQRALAWLSHSRLTSLQNNAAAKSALKAAAYTYVVAALTSLATLLYYIMIFLGGRRN